METGFPGCIDHGTEIHVIRKNGETFSVPRTVRVYKNRPLALNEKAVNDLLEEVYSPLKR